MIVFSDFLLFLFHLFALLEEVEFSSTISSGSRGNICVLLLGYELRLKGKVIIDFLFLLFFSFLTMSFLFLLSLYSFLIKSYSYVQLIWVYRLSFR